MRKRSQRAEQPVEAAVIRDITTDGRGIAGVAGKTVFVDAAITDEFVRFKRRRRRKSYDEADLIEVLRASPERSQPPCEYFDICGGCKLQHMHPEAQLAAKERALFDAFERIGKVVPDEYLPALAGKPLGYRRRARMGAKLVEKKGRVLVGFREKHKPYIAEMHSCQTLSPRLSELIDPLALLIADLSISRQIPQVEMSLGDETLSLVFRVLQNPNGTDRERLRVFAEAHEADIWLQSGGPNTLAPLDPAKPPAPLWYQLPVDDLRLEFGPLDFIQVNQDMNRRMIAQAMKLLGDISGYRVLDLFCGIGNFSLPLATRATQVTGVELDPVMVGKARVNAELNGLDNVEFHAADLTATDGLPDWWQQGFDVIVLDPPRAGAQEVLPFIARAAPATILYVSCHAGSLARDAGILVHEHGYRLKSLGAMDMFPQTSHVEAMAVFERTT